MCSGWLVQLGVRRASIEFILIGFAAFVLVNIVCYEFARRKQKELRRRFRERMSLWGVAPTRGNDGMSRRVACIALAAILIPSTCFPWGRDSHRIAGDIAEKYRTPQAAAAVKD